MNDIVHFDDKLSEEQRERLIILAEECSEVIQGCSKVLRFGYDSYNPTKGFQDNLTLLQKEIGDLYAILHVMYGNGDISYQTVQEFRELKTDRIAEYMKHSIDPVADILKEYKNPDPNNSLNLNY